LSDNLISIGDYAFSDVEGLNNIKFSENVEYIGAYAFLDVDNIDITIPNTIKVIGVNAFVGTEISKNMDDYAIYGDNILIHFPNEETVIVPEGVKVVSNTGSKLATCSMIKEIYIPDTVTYICGWVINKCSDLKIYIPSSVDGIGTMEGKELIPSEYIECIDEITVVVESGSYAESYAKENNINYEIVDSVQALYEAAASAE
jgi:hypothetical protein